VVYREVRLDTKNPDTFRREGCFDEAIEAALAHNSTDADFDKFRIKDGKEKAPGKETIAKILQNPEWKSPTPPNREIITPSLLPKVDEDMISGLLKEMQELRIYRQQMEERGERQRSELYYGRPGKATVATGGPPYDQFYTRRSPFDAAGPVRGMSLPACHWCGNDGHIKARCPDYQNCLAQQIVHHTNLDTRTRLGPQGSDGTVVPLPEYSGLWQHVWVDRDRRKPKSAMQQPGGRIE
jgi:hypothetical protein